MQRFRIPKHQNRVLQSCSLIERSFMYVYVPLPELSAIEEVYIHLCFLTTVSVKSDYMASN
jgi:hypothetical protein